MGYAISKCFRSGRLIGEELRGTAEFAPQSGGQTTRYIAITLESQIDIGCGDIHTERTKVLLIGDPVIAYWDAITPRPKAGDEVRLSYCIAYHTPDAICCRVFHPEEVEVIPAQVAVTSSHRCIQATDYFRTLFQERKQQ